MQMISGDPFSLSSSIIQPFPPEHPSIHPSNPNPKPNPPHPLPKKKRNLPGTPDPDAEVIALSPKSLMATNRFICEICNKGFQRDQNLQLHRRGHNLPWKLRQRSNKEVRKKVYICPEKTCVHHDPSRALGDLTGIKKHYSRKHGEKKWKCDKCSKKYAVQSDWKAHTKTCGTREYKCDCGTLFSRKDSFITHRAFCDALTEESARLTSVDTSNLNFKSEESSHVMMNSHSHSQPHGGFAFSQFGTHGLVHNGMGDQQRPSLSMWLNQLGNPNGNSNPLDVGLYNVSSSTASGLPDVYNNNNVQMTPPTNSIASSSLPNYNSGLSSSASLAKSSSEIAKPASPMSATALLQKAAQMGSTRSTNPSIFSGSFGVMTSSSSHTHNTQPSLDNNTDHHQNRSNELNQVFQSMKQQQADNNFGGSSSNAGHNNNGMMRMSNNTMNNNNNFVGSLTHSSSSGLDEVVLQQQQQPNARVQGNNHHHKQVLKDSSNSGEHGYTRDFLGMGGGEAGASAGHPSFLPQDIANFATMQPALLSEN